MTNAAGAPVAGAQLRLIPADGDASDARAATSDSAGAFGWSGLSAGRYQLTARRLGFQPVSVTFDLADGVERQATIQLTAVQQLDTVRTQTTTSLTPSRYGPSSKMDEFYRRMHEGNGKFITREQIDSMTAISSADLFRRVPGVTATFLTNGSVIVHAIGCRATSVGNGVGDGGSRPDGWGGVALYVDGLLIRGDRGLTLGTLPPSQIEAIEIYRNATELPDEAMGNACAAVYVWTRVGADSTGHSR